METVRLDGKALAAKKRESIREGVEKFTAKSGFAPGLAVIIVGDNPASHSYVRGKEKACEKAGILSEKQHLSADVSEKELLDMIGHYNEAPHIHGILVQLPLPDHISESKVIEQISADKDVDGFHPISVGRMVTGQKTLLPCTPAGIMEILKAYDITLSGKNAVVLGRSNIVGKPMAQLLLNEHATVTVCHSRTPNMKDLAKSADIVISAIGKPGLVDDTYIKEGAVVIDVGISRLEDGTLTGDVDEAAVQGQAGHLTPVPGGVGPMTITMLLANTLQAAEEQTA
ncbi:methenyltetrahydrofolate cyclohydrolase /5,10-methylenetetrahydrofolate dehydrogenase (NADP+) [Salsuginibacillus halophilus]|uniref:Bifunctional protein FolD n=1 Tax=Salsuginibacillus halophilus TaxID=517424 RepID=A0A2P8HAE3_9BACI|nr:bifunctional methylenetetrahydrofolate dehydrogenase/methenyltetrahydrofolate cyclohydrolase FolD [Salsuginibacillus halophilus]PSL43197.1 methenyltetrahydrofolate cyclohydrolase /5,10-methylenetetrahydrofolate dehydrogenase (NADP+) [Salsuginibacillus halophilus]